MGRRVLRRVLRRGSKKGLSRRHLEGRSTPFRVYDPVGVCPRYGDYIRYGDRKTVRRVLGNACFSRRKRQEHGTDNDKLRR